MPAHHAVDGGADRLVELGGPQADRAVGHCRDLGVRAQLDVDHTGVEQGQELLGPQRGGPGLEPVDPAPHVGLEVDIRLEGQAAELDDGPQLVAQDPEDLLGRLDRTSPLGQGLVEVGLDHVVHLGLVVGARGVVAIGAGEDVLAGSKWP